ncbi:MAG TPA: MotA/TolQ/ExbB proton channel family protein [Candidatus Methylomirabilis sp.]|jgi:biopolymer transport protein TolQ
MSPVDLIRGTGWVGWGVLLTLLFFSLASWTLIFFKWRTLRRTIGDSERFAQRFRASKNLYSTYEETRTFPHAATAALFREGYRELSQMVRANPGPGDGPRGREAGVAVLEEISVPDALDRVRRAVRHASIQQIAELERHLIFLATTGSVTPFIGLFGTVWGIMHAFAAIGTMGSASLAVVAPGIAEALINTAAGLVAAVPAVIAYNFLLNRIKAVATILDLFSLEFLGIAERLLLRRS